MGPEDAHTLWQLRVDTTFAGPYNPFTSSHGAETGPSSIPPSPRHLAQFPCANHINIDVLEDHSSTPPIPVPSSSSPRYGAGRNAIDHVHLHEPSPRRSDGEPRRPSVTFNPFVFLDSGHERRLDEPLPKSGRWTPSPTRKKRSMLSELSDRHLESRSNSSGRPDGDAEGANYSHFGPELGVDENKASESAESRLGFFVREGPSSLLHSGVEEMTRESFAASRERMASLTSASTASPPLEEARTPPELNSELTLSSPTASFLARRPKTFDEGGAWSPMAGVDMKPRAGSYTFGKRDSSRKSSRRASSLRSPSATSPASAFLRTWGKPSRAAAVEPDAEGQEIGDYVLGKQIGFGGFSVVKEAFTIENGERCIRAVKIVRKHIGGRSEQENERVQQDFEHEVSLWRGLRHPFILPLLLVYDTSFATYCFTPLHAGGTLFDLVRANRKGLPVDLVKRYAAQLASAIRYLHEDAYVVHRDVKLENCLVDVSDPETAARGGNVRLCDFGMAQYIQGGGDDGGYRTSRDAHRGVENQLPLDLSSASDTAGPAAGSLEYAAPEVLTSSAGLCSTAVDIWAFGVVVYALLAGDLPFRHTFLPRVQMLILGGEWDEDAVRFAPGMDQSADEAVDLIRGCLDMDPDHRWTIRQVLEGAFLEDARGEFETDLNRGWKL